MTSTDDLRASGYALLRLAEFIDRNAPGLLPDNPDVGFARPSVMFDTDRADVALSYQAALRDAMIDPYTYQPRYGLGRTTNAIGSPIHVTITGPAPERITDDRS